MPINEAIQELSVALERKLRRYGEDIRQYRKKPSGAQDSTEFECLKANRKTVDQTLSACKKNLQEPDPALKTVNYRAHKRVYDQL